MNRLLYRIDAIMAIAKKECLDILRDRVSLLMLCLIPIINLFVVGYSINMDTKQVSSALLDNDKSTFSRTFINGMKNTGYFDLILVDTEKAAVEMLKKGKVQFMITIPTGFSGDLISGKKPEILIQLDGTDPATTANALRSVSELIGEVFKHDIKNINGLENYDNSIMRVTVHNLYNPENISRYNTVPGLIGVISSIMIILLSCLSFVRERESGALIHIINSKTNSLEIFIGKSIPSFFIGIVLSSVMIMFSVVVMQVPLTGSLLSMLILLIIFNITSLCLGGVFAAITKTQLQAMQLSSFFFLLSNMLSGFISPFSGMPKCSQWLGEILPLTYFLRLSRGIMLKNYSLLEMSEDFSRLLIMLVLLALLSYASFHRMLKHYQ